MMKNTGRGVEIRCEGRGCRSAFRAPDSATWPEIDGRILAAGWARTSKNGTWHHFCPAHRGLCSRVRL